MTYRLRRIEPTPDNAWAIRNMIATDLRDGGLSEVEISQHISPEAIQQELALKRRRYVGAVAVGSGRLLGYSHSGVHRAADQEKYGGPLDRDITPQRHLGIFAVCVDRSQWTGAQQSIGGRLIDDLTRRHGPYFHDARIGIQPGDPLEALFLERGFEPTGKYAEITEGIKAQLHVRQL